MQKFIEVGVGLAVLHNQAVRNSVEMRLDLFNDNIQSGFCNKTKNQDVNI